MHKETDNVQQPFPCRRTTSSCSVMKLLYEPPIHQWVVIRLHWERERKFHTSRWTEMTHRQSDPMKLHVQIYTIHSNMETHSSTTTISPGWLMKETNQRLPYLTSYAEMRGVWGGTDTPTDTLLERSASCVQRFDDSLIMQFALRIAFRCVLHRCRSLDIHCWNCWMFRFYQKMLLHTFLKYFHSRSLLFL